MIFSKLFQLFKKGNTVNTKYAELVRFIMESPLWDGSDEQILDSLPKDFSQKDLEYLKKKIGIEKRT